MANNDLLIATKNPGKAREFQQLFAPLGFTIKTLLDYPDIDDIPETGSSFLENASQKASTAAKLLQVPTIADDSGLEIEALNGEPGVYSARYAGLDKNDQANRQKVLLAMEAIPDGKRQAQFTCALVLSHSDGQVYKHYIGHLAGEILREERGSNGFGYDSIFYLPDYQKTTAEIDPDLKNKISHRGQAMAQLKADIEAGKVELQWKYY